MFLFFDAPHGVAAMSGEAIERADFGQGPQFVFIQINAQFKILDGYKWVRRRCSSRFNA